MAKKDNLNDVQARVLPNSLEAEQAVLCSCMIDNDAAINIVSKLEPADVYSQAHKTIFEAIVDLYQKNKPIDIITLTDALETKGVLQAVGGVSYLTSLTNVLPSTG